ncbi:MAG TPA: DeoR/GlpR family DNA-binding transcription regulator [Propionibacteriaceae bacterium]
MLKVERRRQILTRLRDQGVATTDDLAAEFGVSGETIRRDIAMLEQEGQAVRVHGGATLPSRETKVPDEPPFEVRREEYREAKARIGRTAAGLLTNGTVVALDVGTTSLHIAQAIPSTFQGVVVTSSVLVAAELSTRTGVEVLLSGGRVRGGDLACSGSQTVDFFRDVHPDIAFLASGGLTTAAGLTDFHREEVAVRRQLLRNAAQAYVVVDASKVGRVAPYVVCGLRDLTGVITDQAPPADLVSELSRSGGILEVAAL